jgi:peptidoglycan/xylan/chitin deacetylase (PgdA/CDA1 family)
MNPDEFDAQMTTLKSIGEVVPLDWLLQRGRRVPSRPHFAITFDDDDPAHINGALPILQKHQIQATFFLSGRSLHGLGPYWWTALEQSARAVGLEATCHAVGVHARTLKELVRGCRHKATVKELPVEGPTTVMSTTDIRMLSDAGMSIGFHTVTHPALTRLSERDLREAVTVGRDALAALARARVDLFAYPYGDVDCRVADAVRTAGYSAAFALRHRPVHAWCDRFNVPRWQPSSFGIVDFAGETALRLSRRVSRLGRGAPPP